MLENLVSGEFEDVDNDGIGGTDLGDALEIGVRGDIAGVVFCLICRYSLLRLGNR